MGTLSILAAAVCCALVLAAPAQAREVSLTGQVELTHIDSFKGGKSRDSYRIARGQGRPSISLGGARPKAQPGSRVRVRGTLRGRRLKTKRIRKLRSARPRARVAVAGERKVAVILLNFQDAAGDMPWTTDEARSAVFTGADSANAFYQEESSGAFSIEGKYRPDGDVYGWYTVPFDRSGPCAASQWIASARQIAEQDLALQGKDLSGYDNIHFSWPSGTNCSFGGGTSINAMGTYTSCNGNIQTWCVAHEFGHWLGIGHANGYSCREGGQQVPISHKCTVLEYYDPFDIMGVPGSTRQHNGQHKSELDFLSGSVQTVTEDGTYSLSPSEPGFGGAQLLQIPRTKLSIGNGTDYFNLDFRQPYGVFDQFPFGSPVTNGVSIRIDDDVVSRGPSSLIDTNPNTDNGGWGEYNDAPLTVGETFEDPISGIRLTTISAEPSGAEVKVQLPGAEVSGSVLRYRAWMGEANDVTVTGGAGGYTITDRGSTAVGPGDGCSTTPDPQTVTCTGAGVETIEVATGDLDDRATVASDTPARIDGGGGSDTLIGGSGDDTLSGSSDKFGRDVLVGGGGTDTVDYSQRFDRKLKIDLDGRPDDGAPGERDNVGVDVENVLGGQGADRLAGNEGPNVLHGNDGNDTVTGDDGDDTLTGGGGLDTLNGGDGNDTIDAIDGARDKINCGRGFDPFPAIDALDRVSSC